MSVVIPASMPVSENPNVRIPPDGYLNWWGDPPGDRKQQVRALLSEAVSSGAAPLLTGSTPVIFEIKVNQFHALTPKARATELQLGVHSMNFDFAVIDKASGARLTEENNVNADLRAYSGSYAVIAEQQGQNQKLRIQNRIADVASSWLTN